MLAEPPGLNIDAYADITFESLSACVCPETVTNRFGYVAGGVHALPVPPALPVVPAAPLPAAPVPAVPLPAAPLPAVPLPAAPARPPVPAAPVVPAAPLPP